MRIHEKGNLICGIRDNNMRRKEELNINVNFSGDDGNLNNINQINTSNKNQIKIKCKYW